MWRILLLGLIFLVPATAGAQRDLTVTGEQRVALVIGNSEYKDSPLANPVNDATDIANALRQFGFKVILKRDAGTREMRQAVREFGAELRRAQVGLFYFAGHGVQVRGENYLVPVGADIQSEADVEDLSINTSYVLRTMEEVQAKVSIVILDACRNNPFARSFRSAARGLAQMNAATGSLIAFATAPGSVAADGTGRNGTFTKHLLANLNQADTDILKVFQRTRAGVVKETGGKQTPWESTSLVGDFYFRFGMQVAATAPVTAPIPAPAPAPDPATIELTFWESVKNSSNAADFKEYLNQYPTGRFAGLARNRIATLTSPPPPQAGPVTAPSAVSSPSASASTIPVRDLHGRWEPEPAANAWIEIRSGVLTLFWSAGSLSSPIDSSTRSAKLPFAAECKRPNEFQTYTISTDGSRIVKRGTPCAWGERYESLYIRVK